MTISSFIKKLKEVNKWNLSKLLPGYKFNNLIFKIGIGLIFVWILIAGFNHGWDWKDKPYFVCNDQRGCENPWHSSEADPLDPFSVSVPCVNPVPGRSPDFVLCSKDHFLFQESYGRPPDFFMKNASAFAWFVVIVMILLNHFLFNRGYGKTFKKILEKSNMEE